MEVHYMDDQHFVYIIKRRSKKGGIISYYTGQTNNVLRRATEHKKGQTKANKGYDIIGVAIIAIVSTRSTAMLFEKKLKTLTQKRKMEVYNGGKNIDTA